jgi:hypothetical protein
MAGEERKRRGGGAISHGATRIEGDGGSSMVGQPEAHGVGDGRSQGVVVVGRMAWVCVNSRGPLRPGRRRLTRGPYDGLNEFKKFQTDSNPNQIHSN